MLGCHAVLEGHHARSRASRQETTDGVVGIEAAAHEAAAVPVDEPRRWGGGVGGNVEPAAHRLPGPEHQRELAHFGKRERFRGERVADGVELRPILLGPEPLRALLSGDPRQEQRERHPTIQDLTVPLDGSADEARERSLGAAEQRQRETALDSGAKTPWVRRHRGHHAAS